jgi:hypothetical protein
MYHYGNDLPSFVQQIVIHVVIICIAERLVNSLHLIDGFDGCRGASSCRIIVKKTMNGCVGVQQCVALFQVAYGVENDEVTRLIQRHSIIGAALGKRQIRQEVHETLEQAAAFLLFSVQMVEDAYILMKYASLEIRIADFVTAREVLEGDGKVPVLVIAVMHLVTIHPTDLRIHATGAQIGEERIVAQWYNLNVRHLLFDGLVQLGLGIDLHLRDIGAACKMLHGLEKRTEVEHQPAKVYDVATLCRAEVIPLVLVVVHLEGRMAFLTQRRTVPMTCAPYLDRLEALRRKPVYYPDLFCFFYSHNCKIC